MGARWVVLGARGLLGRHMIEELGAQSTLDGSPGAWEICGFGRAEAEITDRAALRRALAGADVVLNCAAWTAVDAAEADPEGALRVNRDGAALVARVSAEVGATLVHLSTDFVFDGDHAPYWPGSEARPLSAYGRSKLAGERAVLASGARATVIRVQALYGAGGRTFSSRLFGLLEGRAPSLRLDAERLVQPTWARLAARRILTLSREAPPGVYHVSAEGEATWAEFARAAAQGLAAPADFTEVPTGALTLAARRPRDSRFDHAGARRGGLGHWREGLAAFLAERSRSG